MSTTVDPQQAFHRGTTPIFAILSTDQVRQMAHLPVESSLADRVEELAGKSNEGCLTTDGRAEYEENIEANNLMAILQAEAEFRLQQSGA